MHVRLLFCLFCLTCLHWAPSAQSAAPAPNHAVLCENGMAEGFPCNKVNLAAHITNSQMGGSAGNDIWGWTDPLTGKEYALMGLNNGTAFVDISDPEFPIRLGRLPTHTSNSSWRDIKTYGNYAYIVSEAVDHGLQVFDLRRLRNVAAPPVVFTEDAHYAQFGRAHNIVIDTDSGFAFAVGSQQGSQTCSAGLHMIDIRNPLSPVFAGCFGSDGYTHDAQCLTYSGPDTEHVGKEICLAANEDTVTIVDVSNKSAPVQLSRTSYAGSAYTHQGWLTPDGRYFLVNDEIDEINNGHNTRTYVFAVSNLDLPVLHTIYTGPVAATDHNLYVHNGYAYESNYRSGLRIVDLANIDGGVLTEAAFFDTQPATNASGTSGAWSVYPFFASGRVVVSDISAGLFVLEPQLCNGPDAASELMVAAAGDNQIQLSWDSGVVGGSFDVYRAIDGCGGVEALIAEGVTSPAYLDQSVSGGISYGYRIRQRSADGQCRSEFSSCQAASTSGTCSAPPIFAGLVSATSGASSQCAIELDWAAATSRCAGPNQYRVERSLGNAFDAQTATLVATGLTATQYSDADVESASLYSYRVQAIDSSNGAADGNNVAVSVRADGPASDGNFNSGAEIGDTLLNITGTRHVGWEVVDNVAHTGSRSYFSTYANGNCLQLFSPALTITAGQSAELAFHTRYAIESGWDGSLVQVSSDGGSNWTTIAPQGGYPAAMNNQNSTDACGFANGQPVFSGSNLNWLPYVFNLSAFSGEIQLRWLFSSDGSQTDQGWWLDGISISHVQVPSLCSGSTLFDDGFESP